MFFPAVTKSAYFVLIRFFIETRGLKFLKYCNSKLSNIPSLQKTHGEQYHPETKVVTVRVHHLFPVYQRKVSTLGLPNRLVAQPMKMNLQQLVIERRQIIKMVGFEGLLKVYRGAEIMNNN